MTDNTSANGRFGGVEMGDQVRVTFRDATSSERKEIEGEVVPNDGWDYEVGKSSINPDEAIRVDSDPENYIVSAGRVEREEHANNHRVSDDIAPEVEVENISGTDAEDGSELVTDGGVVVEDGGAGELKAYDVQPGQVYQTSGGERIEVVRDDMRGSKPLLVRYPERTQLDEDGNEVVATACMSRYNFADMATFDGFTLVEEDTDLGDVDCDDDEPEQMPGEWLSTPRCPVCARFMSRGCDGAGLPAAQCSRAECEYVVMDVDELIEAGHFEPGAD